MKTLRDLLEYELAWVYDGHRKMASFLYELADEVPHDGSRVLLRQQAEEVRAALDKLKRGFDLLGIAPRQVPQRSLEGCIAEYAEFRRTQPAPLVHAVYVLGCVTKMSDLERGKCRGLVDVATQLELTELADLLRDCQRIHDGHADAVDHTSHDLAAAG